MQKVMTVYNLDGKFTIYFTYPYEREYKRHTYYMLQTADLRMLLCT